MQMQKSLFNKMLCSWSSEGTERHRRKTSIPLHISGERGDEPIKSGQGKNSSCQPQPQLPTSEVQIPLEHFPWAKAASSLLSTPF